MKTYLLILIIFSVLFSIVSIIISFKLRKRRILPIEKFPKIERYCETCFTKYSVQGIPDVHYPSWMHRFCSLTCNKKTDWVNINRCNTCGKYYNHSNIHTPKEALLIDCWKHKYCSKECYERTQK